MGRPLNWEKLTVIINTIRKKPSEWKDLRKLGIPEKTLQRYIREYLGDKGVDLVEKKGRFWVWRGYEYPKEYTPEEYTAAIGHAQDLLPGFDALLEYPPPSSKNLEHQYLTPTQAQIKRLRETAVFVQDILNGHKQRFILSKYVEQHLKWYPEIHNHLVKFRNLSNKLAKTKQRNLQFLKKFEGAVLGPNRMFVDWEKRTPESWLRKLFPEWDAVKEDIPYLLGPFSKQELKEATKQIASHNGFVEKDKVWFIKGPIFLKVPSGTKRSLTAFVETGDLMIRAYGELAKQIHELKIKVRRQPLDGHCDLCPSIIIREEPPKTNQKR